MVSRYDTMNESVVVDVDGICYPDPLVDYTKGKLSSIPSLYTITDNDLRNFWICMWENYQMNHSDDYWLNINGVPYLMDLKPGDQIYKITPSDLKNYLKSRQKGTE